ncbi:unnamed protein product [Phaedon cochleariae]|uniref:Lipase domain-containing protein n=1 Tax=Phaedon cochleariae TaxID=80249 RepID=A0A9P0GW69_PHACE|nr:unnamed protein product [Phaedon cochleariae]
MSLLTYLSTGLCLLYSQPGPFIFKVENLSFVSYPIDRRICPKIDPVRDIIFELYTSANPSTPQILSIDNDSSVVSSNIDFSLPTKIFVHGFLESSNADDAFQIKERYLQLGNYNVILVNTERLFAGISYPTAARNVLPVGQFTAKFIDFLVTRGLKLSATHLIGMSLGAHVVGIAGQLLTSGKVSRVTGLDPARQLFESVPENERIGQNSGVFVDIVHTNAGGFGLDENLGSVDIWINGGKKQPGCSISESWRRTHTLSEILFCNHRQADRLYIMSLINPKSYPITQCDSYEDFVEGNCRGNDITYLGEDMNPMARGNYYGNPGATALTL